MPPLPPELVDLIISYLYGDSYSLKTCSLVCRAWVPRSRHYLFFNPVQVQLGVEDYCERFLKIFGGGNELSQYVRSLTILGPPQTKNHDILQCINTFNNMEELRLVRLMNPYNWATTDPVQRAQWFIPFGSVRRLHISSSSVSFTDFLTLLRHIPLLSELTLEIVSWTSSWQMALVTQRDSSECLVPHLRKLKFGTRSAAVIPAFTALFSRKFIPRVSSLIVCDISRVHAQDVGDLLRTLGPSLQSLKVSSDNLLRGDVTRTIDLRHNFNLTHLTLEDLFASKAWNLFVSDFSDWALELLNQLPGGCHKMEKITLGFVLVPEDGLEGVKWPSTLETLHRLSVFSHSFKSIKFRFLCHPDRLSWLERIVCERLYSLKQFLRFKRVDF